MISPHIYRLFNLTRKIEDLEYYSKEQHLLCHVTKQCSSVLHYIIGSNQ